MGWGSKSGNSDVWRKSSNCNIVSWSCELWYKDIQLYHCVSIETCLFSSDWVPTVLVKEWPLVYTTCKGDPTPLGPPLDAPLWPVPVLFADNVEAAKRALSADPDQARRDFLRLISQMLIPRNIAPGEAAFAVVSQSQPREADVSQPCAPPSAAAVSQPWEADVSQPCAPPSAAETVSESGTVPTW
jgi:hypothetical protein